MTSAAPSQPTVKPQLIIGALCFGGLAGSLMQSLVIPLQSLLPTLLGTTPSNASWVITATLLGGAVAMPIAGRLADLFGKRPVMIAATILLLAGSLVCAVSDSFIPVVIGRVLQGLAMGYFPVALSLVREVAPPRLRASAIAAVSATFGVGSAIGLPLAAWISQNYDWHMLFWLATVLSVAVFAATVVAVPFIKPTSKGSFDVIGAIGLTIGLVAFLVGVSKGSTWGWGSGLTLGAVFGGLALLGAWGFYEVRHHDPLVDLRVTIKRPVLMTNLAALLVGFGMMAQSIVIPQLLQMPTETGFGLGQSILAAGLWMAPSGIVMMLFTPVSSTLLNKMGGRVTLITGALVLAAGYFVAAFLMNAPWQLMLAACITSAGVGIGYAAMPSLIMENVPTSEAASCVGVNSLMRSMGTTIAGAVMAAVMSGNTQSFAGAQIPTHSAYQWCFLLGGVAAVAGAVLAFLVPRPRKGIPTTAVVPKPAAAEPVPA